MMHRFELDGVAIEAQADGAAAVPDGMLLRGREVAIELPFAPVRFYRHGWQSWSLTTWQDAGERIPRPKPALLLPMQTDPRYARDDAPQRVLGGRGGASRRQDPAARSTRPGNPRGTRREPPGRAVGGRHGRMVRDGWRRDRGVRPVRGAAGRGFRRGRARAGDPPRVWCSWYSLYTAIDERILHRLIDQVAGMPFEVFQVDDGWQAAIGDWEANGKFSSGMEALAARIRGAGFVPGLWLAPLLAVPSSRLHREHPEWLLRDGKGQARVRRVQLGRAARRPRLRQSRRARVAGSAHAEGARVGLRLREARFPVRGRAPRGARQRGAAGGRVPRTPCA